MDKHRKDIDNLVKQIASGNFTHEEFLEFSELFTDKKSLNRVKLALEKEWQKETFDGFGDRNLTPLLKKIKSEIKSQDENISLKSKLLTVITRAAAILLIPVLAVAIYLYRERVQYSREKPEVAWAEIQSPQGARTAFELPDGTTGFLNSNSRLKYPVRFNSNRYLELTGEAYFDVKHKNQSEFVVATPYCEVKVLGTRFDVISYPEEEFVDIILEKGKVEVTDKSHQTLRLLEPDQKFSYNKKTNQFDISDVDAELYVSWTTGKLRFKNELLPDVLQRLSRRYYADFIIEDKQLENYRYRATFENESIDQILKLLSLTAPISYRVIEPKQLEYEKNSKKQIYLMLKN